MSTEELLAEAQAWLESVQDWIGKDGIIHITKKFPYADKAFVGRLIDALIQERSDAAALRKQYRLLVDAVNDSNVPCVPDCDSLAHAENCPNMSAAKEFETLGGVIAALREQKDAIRKIANREMLRADAAEERIRLLGGEREAYREAFLAQRAYVANNSYPHNTRYKAAIAGLPKGWNR